MEGVWGGRGSRKRDLYPGWDAIPSRILTEHFVKLPFLTVFCIVAIYDAGWVGGTVRVKCLSQLITKHKSRIQYAKPMGCYSFLFGAIGQLKLTLSNGTVFYQTKQTDQPRQSLLFIIHFLVTVFSY